MEKKKPEISQQDLEMPEPEEYSFLQETIKEDVGGAKKIRNLITKGIIVGLVFGAMACLSFYALKPVMEKLFPSKTEQIVIPEEELPDVSEEEAAVSQENQAATIDDYEELNQLLYGVATEASRSVVEITALAKDNGFDSSYDKQDSIAGVIVFDIGDELLIYGKNTVAHDAEALIVTFSDGKRCSCELKKEEKILGFAMYSVDKSLLENSTKKQIKVVKLGSSYTVNRGDGVVALGNPFGYFGSVGYGVQASVKNTVTKEDGEFRLLCTDIAASGNGTGILVNLQGELVGMIDQSVSDSESMNLVTAYGISDLKSMMEYLSNNRAVPYIGIKGVSITDELSEELGIPIGIYVQEVQADSPAMKSGIQTGDVLTELDEKKVRTLSDYHNELMKKGEGQKIKIQGKRQGNGEYVDIEYSVIIENKQ